MEAHVIGGVNNISKITVQCCLTRTPDLLIARLTLYGLIPQTLGPFNVFILLNGFICLHGVLN